MQRASSLIERFSQYAHARYKMINFIQTHMWRPAHDHYNKETGRMPLHRHLDDTAMPKVKENMRGAIGCMAPWRLPAASGLTPILNLSSSSLVPSSVRRGVSSSTPISRRVPSSRC